MSLHGLGLSHVPLDVTPKNNKGTYRLIKLHQN